MKKDKKINALFLCIAELIVGILLLIKPIGFTSGIIICAGIGLMVKGLVEIIRYFRTSAQTAAQSFPWPDHAAGWRFLRIPPSMADGGRALPGSHLCGGADDAGRGEDPVCC